MPHADGTAALDKALDVLDAVGEASQGLRARWIGLARYRRRLTLAHWRGGVRWRRQQRGMCRSLVVPSPSGVELGGPQGDTLCETRACEAVTRESLDAAPLPGRLFVHQD